MDVPLSTQEKKVSECIGLWLAEGSTRSKSEITFTNNCWELVELFHKTISKLFSKEKYNIRIYIYSREGREIKIPFKNIAVKNYIHKKATKPFYIYRIASIKLMKKWRKIVDKSLKDKRHYRYILRGFFAGEGNIHTGSHNTRRIRISQGTRKEFIENLLKHFNIEFSFREKNRNYVIYGKWNWDIFSKLSLADLHPDKKIKFWRVYNSFKEEHYRKGYLIKEVSKLKQPFLTKDLSKIFNRSPARIRDVLVELKKQKKIKNFRVGSVDYWTNDKNLIIISKLKKEYLFFLDMPRKTSEFARHFCVDWKSSFERLKELKNLNLVRREPNGEWIKLNTKKKIMVI